MGKLSMGELPFDFSNQSNTASENLDDAKKLGDAINAIIPHIESLTFCLNQQLESDQITNTEIKELLNSYLADLMEKTQNNVRKMYDKNTSMTADKIDYEVKYSWPQCYFGSLLMDCGSPEKGMSWDLQIKKAQKVCEKLHSMQDALHEIVLKGTEFDTKSMPVERLHQVVEHSRKINLFSANSNYSELLFIADMRTPQNSDREGFGRYNFD